MVAKEKKLAPWSPSVASSECRHSAQIVAGLDLSLRAAGVAVLFPDGKVRAQTFGYGLSHGTKRDQIERLILISTGIIQFIREHKVACVGIEDYGFASKGRLSAQADLGGTLKTQLYVVLKSCPLLLASMQVRKFLLGEATKDKTRVQAYLQKHFSGPTNLDEWDALAVAVVADAWLNKREQVIDPYRIEVLDEIDTQTSRSDDGQKKIAQLRRG